MVTDRRNPRRAGVLLATALLVAGASLLSVASAAPAAPAGWISGEVGGGNLAARNATQALQNPWRTSVLAHGGSLETLVMSPASTPSFASGAAISGTIGTASNGTSVAVQRTRYTAGGSPTYIGVSTNPGTATCSGSGNELQDSSPRPTSLVSPAGCATGGGFGYSASGGNSDDSSTRDGLEFFFSAPVLAFGAWIGDLETRNDNGVPALLRLYDADGALLSETVVASDETLIPQANCGTGITGCGNRTTRWIGFEAEPSAPISRMVLIVGEHTSNASGANAQGISFIGPTIDVSSAGLSLAKSHAPLTDTNGDGMLGAGDRVDYTFTVTNTGTRPASDIAIIDAGATGLSCPDTSTAPLAGGDVLTCTGSHVLTQPEVDAGGYVNSASATGTVSDGAVASAVATDTVSIVAAPVLDLALVSAPAAYSVAGDEIVFDYTLTNSGNVTLSALALLETVVGGGSAAGDCATALPVSLAPGSTAVCSLTYTVAIADLAAGPVGLDALATATAPGGAAGAVQSLLVNGLASYVAPVTPPADPPVTPSEPGPNVTGPAPSPDGSVLALGGAAQTSTAPALAAGALIAVGGIVFWIAARKRSKR